MGFGKESVIETSQLLAGGESLGDELSKTAFCCLCVKYEISSLLL